MPRTLPTTTDNPESNGKILQFDAGRDRGHATSGTGTGTQVAQQAAPGSPQPAQTGGSTRSKTLLMPQTLPTTTDNPEPNGKILQFDGHDPGGRADA
ncbi:hypothetical protein [Amycolatopsis albispora]|uniref:hypothetical protein n=1 Tax=Amycolatopsis albispora TaxID=1804986 RepID=UPI0013B3AC26|nr:hypothetical protein [Amycolatopsis albispora]